jgi:hypothetical protein
MHTVQQIAAIFCVPRSIAHAYLDKPRAGLRSTAAAGKAAS